MPLYYVHASPPPSLKPVSTSCAIFYREFTIVREVKLNIKSNLLAVLAIAGLVSTVMMFNRPSKVSVFQLKPRIVVQALSVVGRAQPEQNITVHTQVGGKLEKVFVSEGQRVLSGQPLARIESSEAEADLAQANAELSERRAEAALNSAILAGDLRERDRLRQLSSAQTIATADLDRAETALQSAEARTKASEANVRAAEAKVQAVTARLSRHTLFAPLDGIVLERAADEGQTLASYAVVFALGGGGSLEIEAEADEAYAGGLVAGQSARLRATGGAKTFPSVVKELLPNVNPTTGARRVRLSAPADQADLVPGRTVEATIVIEKRDSGLSIPRTALLDAVKSPAVFVVEKGRVVRRPVRFRDWPAPEVLVLDGLVAGDFVVSDPTQVTVGARVDPVVAGPATDSDAPTAL